MNRVDKPSQTAAHASLSTDGAARLQEPWLTLARVVWMSLVVLAYILLVAEVPATFASLHMLHAPNRQLFTGQLTPADVQTLQAWGLSLNFYATALLLFSLLFQFSYAAMGILLFWRRADERIALYTSFALLMLPFGFANVTLQALPTEWAWLIRALAALGNASLLLCGFVFPDGRFVPRWTRWLALLLLGYAAAVAIFPSWQLDRSWLSLGVFFGFVVSVLLLQWYRYHWLSNPRQRQQTKWTLFGVVLAVVGNIVPRLLYAFVWFPRSAGSSLAFALEDSLIMGSMLAIPLTLGFAVLRYRLWDIDVIINRTLVYGSLTALLALIYFGLVIGLESLLRLFTGQVSQSPVIIVASTLAIAALFQPLRHRLQQLIDRRFYRSKYDAAKIIEAFNATLRNQTDLNTLREQLVAVVQKTMQPTHVSLWLRPPERTSDQQVVWKGNPPASSEPGEFRSQQVRSRR